MRALVLDYEKQRLCEAEAPLPKITSPTEVLFRVHEVGICGTDRGLAAFRFGLPPLGESRMIIGHEAFGRVAAVGDSVTHLRPGDWVAPTVRRACDPPCRACAMNRRDLCLTGGYTERGIMRQHGYFAEFAVDDQCDLISIPSPIADRGVLLEPLSVVEKAVSMALQLHTAYPPERALVIGAGSIGLLTACVFRMRGLQPTVCSVEPPDSARARLVTAIGVEYAHQPGTDYDVIIEAAGGPSAVTTGLEYLAPNGVFVVLGAHRSEREISTIQLIMKNQVVAGSVNSSPEAFAQAAADLQGLPSELVDSMVQRMRFEDWQETILGAPSAIPKLVHTL